MFNEWTWQVFCNAAFGPTVPVKIWANVFLDMFLSSLLPVLKLQVWRDDREVRLLWQRALDRHYEEWFTIVYSYFESTWTLKPGIVASNVEQCILWGLLVPGLFHAFWALAVALHLFSRDTGFFLKRKWRSSSQRGKRRCTLNLSGTSVFWAIAQTDISLSHCIEFLGKCCQMPAFLGPRTADYRSIYMIYYLILSIFSL